MTTKKSWKWIDAYEKARKTNTVEKSKMIANKTIKKRTVKKTTLFGFR